jgi:phosphoglycerol transferase MdoB-like AlkP superfamily enzyme
MQKFPRQYQFLIYVTAFTVVLLSAFRLVFWSYFSNPSDPVPGNELLYSLYVGLKFDLRLVLLILLPFFITSGIRWFNPFATNAARLFWKAYLSLVFFILLIFYFTDFAHFAYLHRPLDATVLRFLANFTISMQMVWQTYPVVGLLLLLVLLTSAYTWFIYFIFNRCAGSEPPQRGRLKRVVMGTFATFIILFGMYGKLSYYPLRWSDAFTSTHEFAPAVALNPVLYFFETIKNKNSGYELKTTKKYYDAISDYLGVSEKDKNTLNYSRVINKTGQLYDKQPNVVMVFLESFAHYKTGLSGNPLNPTPHFDALANDSLYFSRFYTPSTGTARSVFTAITGLPDIEERKTSSRNPLIVDQITLINELKGYEKMYFLGGSANWGNIRGMLAHNIHGLKIYEEGSYKADRIDVWGISDLHLFEEASQVFNQQDKPFFAIIQTSGNHRPYTIPQDNRGFKLEQHSDEQLRRYGFISNAEYNSFRYMDHSVGFFMNLAKQQEWFDNTIFIFFGDHGIAGYGGEHNQHFENKLGLTNLHVPLVFYAPQLVSSQKIDRVASEVDILPTLTGLIAGPHTLTTFGRDLLDKKLDTQRYAFTIDHERIPSIGLIGDRYYLKMRPDGNNLHLYDTYSDEPRDDVSKQYPDITNKMRELTLGIFETTRYLRHHNKQQRDNNH